QVLAELGGGVADEGVAAAGDLASAGARPERPGGDGRDGGLGGAARLRAGAGGVVAVHLRGATRGPAAGQQSGREQGEPAEATQRRDGRGMSGHENFSWYRGTGWWGTCCWKYLGGRARVAQRDG